jgi:hypothetical protein
MKYYLIGLAAVGLSSGVAIALPQQWTVEAGGNGHWYEAVHGLSGGITWNEAKEAAFTSGGTLATITSQAENDFVFALVGSDPTFWSSDWVGGPYLGAYQTPNTPVAADGWLWVTGEPWGYTSWATGEPNDGGGPPGETVLQYFNNSKNWNDWEPDSRFIGSSYIVETIPEPATLALLAVGGLAMLRRKRK